MRFNAKGFAKGTIGTAIILGLISSCDTRSPLEVFWAGEEARCHIRKDASDTHLFHVRVGSEHSAFIPLDLRYVPE